MIAPGADSRQCPHYKPKGENLKINCATCTKWVGIECVNHLTLLKQDMMTKKFDELDKLMRQRKAVEGPV